MSKINTLQAESDWDVPTLYTQIRTPNMPADRSADVHLDPEKNQADISLTKQSFAKECDINELMKSNPLVAPLSPEQYASLNFQDLGDYTDYHSAKNYLIEAQNSFMALDANIRAQFQNDPGLFLDFVQDPRNQQALIDMGLAVHNGSKTLSDPEPAPTPAKGRKTNSQAPEEAQE